MTWTPTNLTFSDYFSDIRLQREAWSPISTTTPDNSEAPRTRKTSFWQRWSLHNKKSPPGDVRSGDGDNSSLQKRLQREAWSPISTTTPDTSEAPRTRKTSFWQRWSLHNKKSPPGDVRSGDGDSASLQKRLQREAWSPISTTTPDNSEAPRTIKTSFWQRWSLHNKISPQSDLRSGNGESLSLQKSQQTEAPSPSTITTSEAPRTRKTSFWHCWRLLNKKKQSHLQQDVDAVTIHSPSVTEMSCCTSEKSQGGETGVEFRASPVLDSPVSAHHEPHLQVVPQCSTTIQCTGDFGDVEDGGLDGSSASSREGDSQTGQNSRVEETVLSSTATAQIINNQEDCKESEADVQDNIQPASESQDKTPEKDWYENCLVWIQDV
ncbi:uncharacterized protein LOC118562304 isoform X1 [Fundulus heteroclitus]|uniref:uncharacterized protein LOC118562304 isoform X1 n=1 Tax=Fundulus heteroclitus TaxID=8078 RepID=UPI00165BD3F6|nr:uncharacterized protein LOC118562304 isoform X1 [Fundulus heteroclitus]